MGLIYLLSEQPRTLNTVPEISDHNEATGIASYNFLLGQAASANGKNRVARHKLSLVPKARFRKPKST